MATRVASAWSFFVLMSMTLIAGLRGIVAWWVQRSRDPAPVAPGQVPGRP
jgi:hypothetical protein